MNKTDQFVTKQDLAIALQGQEQRLTKNITIMVADIVSGAIHEVIDVMDDRFNKVETRLDSLELKVHHLSTDVHDLQLGQMRIEHKLDATIERVDQHTITLSKHDKILRTLAPKAF